MAGGECVEWVSGQSVEHTSGREGKLVAWDESRDMWWVGIRGVQLVSGLSRLVGGRRRRGLRHIGTRYTYRLPFAARCDDGDDIVDEWAKSVSGERVE